MTISQLAAWTGLALFPAMMVFAALMDVMTMTIRNRLVMAIVAGYAILAPLAGIPPYEMGLSLALAAGVFVAGFTIFSLGWIGGGDAKLAAATMLWLGTGHLVDYLVYTALFGGGLTLAILAFRQVALPAAWHSHGWMERLHQPRSGVPYGAAMAPAALMVFPHTAWMTATL
jgi:prepilin peptidase CpaA